MAIKNYNLAIIPGDGIGPEVMDVAIPILEKIEQKYGFVIDKTFYPFSGTHFLKTGEILSEESLKKIKTHEAILLGAVGHPKVPSGIIEKELLLKLRFSLDQYINLRPIKKFKNVSNILVEDNDIDCVCVRENVGGLYTGAGGSTMLGTNNETATQTMIYTYKQVRRTLDYAFKLAQKRRKKLTLIGKSNVLTHVFSLWLRVFEELKEEYTDIETEYLHIDAACMFMVKQPECFDVFVTTNMFGDIITDIGAELQGGMGMAASANLNPDKKFPSMFEPVHGSAPDIAGKNKANPIAGILSIQMLLDFLGEDTAAGDLLNKLEDFFIEFDVTRTFTTSEFSTKFLNFFKKI